MRTVIYRQLRESEQAEASRQLTASYRAAYRGLMDEAYLTSLQEDHWVEILQASMERGDICLVAVDGDTIVGAAVCGRSEVRGDQDCAELYAIYLLPEYTEHGAGHGFYCAIEARMRAQGFRSCVLEVLSSNARAIRFYEAHGFEKICSFMVEENGMNLSCDLMQKAQLQLISPKSV